MLNNLIAALPRSLLLGVLCAGAVAQVQAQGRIGYVYTERLMTDSRMAKVADAKIEAEFSKRQKANEELLTRFKQLSAKFESDAPRLSDMDRTRRARELFEAEKDMTRMQREFSEDLLQRKNEERAAIAQKAYKLIEQIAEQEKLDVVLHESAWASPRIDITDKILKLLDK